MRPGARHEAKKRTHLRFGQSRSLREGRGSEEQRDGETYRRGDAAIDRLIAATQGHQFASASTSCDLGCG